MPHAHVDVLIVGAGLSGIGTACHFARECPKKTLRILERRSAIGGTWDLFRYPGVRSDSDMCTMGYDFRPWSQPALLADGHAIRDYIADTAAEFGVMEKILYGFKVLRAEWSGDSHRWSVTALQEATGEMQTLSCSFFVACTGYYDYDVGYVPRFPGEEAFKGTRIHPQQWPESADLAGKKVVVIGSGATAVTLVPAAAKSAAHVTMVQRSPSYIFSVPAFDGISAFLERFLPRAWVYGMARVRNTLFGRALYVGCQRWPNVARRLLLALVRKQVGPGVDMRHFNPRYAPWDERLCFVPDGDLFKALRSGKASVETDSIERFTKDGIRLSSGKQLEADIIVTATGLNIQVLGGIAVMVDGAPRSLNELMVYKGVLLENTPNLAWIFGYTNASWTLKSDIAARYLCRLFHHMDAKSLSVVVPRDHDGGAVNDGIFGSLRSGYVQRGGGLMPRQGRAAPWKVLMNYRLDRRLLLMDPVDDDSLEFTATALARNVQSPAGQPATQPAT